MTDSNSRLFLNNKLKRYEIIERVGTGGMARVYKARDTNLNRTVALKILHEHLVDDPTFMERFAREAQFVASFNHPNIIQLFDYSTFDDEDAGQKVAYMVMPFITGRTLQSVLKEASEQEQRLPDERVLNIILNLTSALGYAHQRGMIHRDVKPANIIFNERDEAILTDFGIARIASGSQLTQEGVTVGTPAYMSPEQATGDPIDARSDLYALGIILYELLTGYPPYEDDGSLSVLLKHLHEPVPSLTKYIHLDNPYLDAVVFKALAKDPNLRYQTADEFANDLKQAFDGIEPEGVSQSRQTHEVNVLSPTQPTQTLDHPTSTVVRKKPQSPLILLTTGLSLVAVVLFIAILTQSNNVSSDGSGGDEAEAQDTGISAMVAAPMFFSTQFNTDDEFIDYWPQDRFNSVERTVTESGYRIINGRSDQAIATIFEAGDGYEDIAIELDATLEESSSPESGYGIIFRYVDEENYYVFAVDGVGRYSIWVLENGIWTELRNNDSVWTEDDAVNPIGEMNALVVELSGARFTGYVNGVKVTTVLDSTFRAGGVGIYTANPPGGETSVLVDAYLVNAMDDVASGVNSMTCNQFGRGLCNEISPPQDDPEEQQP